MSEVGLACIHTPFNAYVPLMYVAGYCEGNGREWVRVYRERLANHQTFSAVERGLQETSQFILSTADYVRQRTTRTPEVEKEILERVPENPKLNTKGLGTEMRGTPKTFSIPIFCCEMYYKVKVNWYITIIDTLIRNVENYEFLCIQNSVNDMNSKIGLFLSLECGIITLYYVLGLVIMPSVMQRNHWLLLSWIFGNILSQC
ncbi:hypothetical protein FQA39_LY11857 [Lamprigera yunnana]|nr:hypothetical protein FQA39_LY11857 [Lamprigera yunnana]